jgi:hypothetical protein
MPNRIRKPYNGSCQISSWLPLKRSKKFILKWKNTNIYAFYWIIHVLLPPPKKKKTEKEKERHFKKLKLIEKYDFRISCM